MRPSATSFVMTVFPSLSTSASCSDKQMVLGSKGPKGPSFAPSACELPWSTLIVHVLLLGAWDSGEHYQSRCPIMSPGTRMQCCQPAMKANSLGACGVQQVACGVQDANALMRKGQVAFTRQVDTGGQIAHLSHSWQCKSEHNVTIRPINQWLHARTWWPMATVLKYLSYGWFMHNACILQ